MENKKQNLIVTNIATNKDVTVSHLQAYCDLFGVSQDEVSDDMVKNYFANHQFDRVQELIDGYAKMANLNEQIVHEFQACDDECFNEFLRN
ncbi:hypothetical protein [Pediococcus damnosus]|nr:hypothetical protein [Pediococcus damnosus]AMV60175.1 Hypothetical protein ADU69_0499 [Pediococcus damnosus]